MEETKEKLPPIAEQLREYIETRLKLAKLEAIDKGSSIIAGMVVDMIIAVSFLLTFLFLSFALAFFLSSVLKSYWAGFGCTAILYLLIGVILIYNRKKFEQPIINLFIKKFF